MNKRQAFIFDLNGTMINDMHFHLEVWFDLLVNELGAKLSREEVKQELYGKNEELLKRIFGDNAFSDEQLSQLSIKKERRYQEMYRPHLDLLPGLFSFLEESYASGIALGIGTAAIPFNVDFVLDNLKLKHYFQTIVTAEDVHNSKPDPETYLKAAELMNVDPTSCIVFEDAPKGVEAAFNAGMRTVVLTTTHQYEEFREYDNVILYVDDYQSLLPSTFIGKASTKSSKHFLLV